MWSILLSNEGTSARRIDRRAGRVGLARIPPCLPLFCFLSHRLRRLLSGRGVAVESGSGAGHRSIPIFFILSVCEVSKVLYIMVLPMSNKACSFVFCSPMYIAGNNMKNFHAKTY